MCMNGNGAECACVRYIVLLVLTSESKTIVLAYIGKPGPETCYKKSDFSNDRNVIVAN